MRLLLIRLACLIATFGMATHANAQAETEPNDSKAAADAFLLPGASTTAVIVGNSTSATGAGLDYFRASVPSRATPGFYRHRLVVTSTTPGHTLTIRGLQQLSGFITDVDVAVQTSDAGTTPQRFVQWYTTETGGDVYIRLTGAAATTSNYSLDYEVASVPIAAGPTIEIGARIVRTTNATSADTDLWIYDGNRIAIPGLGNDDVSQSSSQSAINRTWSAGIYFVVVSDFNLANNLASPPEDFYRDANVLDFPGVLAQSTTLTGVLLPLDIEANLVTLTKTEPYEIKFVRFVVAETPRFRNGFE